MNGQSKVRSLAQAKAGNGSGSIPGLLAKFDVTNLVICCYPVILKIRIFRSRMLETVIEEKVKSRLYNSASEVVHDALRRALCQPRSSDLEEDSPELAALIREGVRSRHTPHRKGDVRKLLARARQRLRR